MHTRGIVAFLNAPKMQVPCVVAATMDSRVPSVMTHRIPAETCLLAAKAVFVDSFTNAYKPLQKTVPELPQSEAALNAFLEDAFADDAADFGRKVNPPRLYIASVDGEQRPLGYLSVDIDPDGKTGYMRQLAVRPEAQGRGVGRALVKRAFADVPDLERVSVSFRRFNTQAEGFYRKMGFTQADKSHPSLDPTLYSALLWRAKGTQSGAVDKS